MHWAAGFCASIDGCAGGDPAGCTTTVLAASSVAAFVDASATMLAAEISIEANAIEAILPDNDMTAVLQC
jgi:hypothetical protein